MENVAVDRRNKIWSRQCIVPGKQLKEIYEKHSTEEQKLHACANFYVNHHTESSWTHLGQILYEEEEMTAARMAKTFIPQTGEINDTSFSTQ